MDYTRDGIVAFREAGTMPDKVQIERTRDRKATRWFCGHLFARGMFDDGGAALPVIDAFGAR